MYYWHSFIIIFSANCNDFWWCLTEWLSPAHQASVTRLLFFVIISFIIFLSIFWLMLIFATLNYWLAVVTHCDVTHTCSMFRYTTRCSFLRNTTAAVADTCILCSGRKLDGETMSDKYTKNNLTYWHSIQVKQIITADKNLPFTLSGQPVNRLGFNMAAQFIISTLVQRQLYVFSLIIHSPRNPFTTAAKGHLLRP